MILQRGHVVRNIIFTGKISSKILADSFCIITRFKSSQLWPLWIFVLPFCLQITGNSEVANRKPKTTEWLKSLKWEYHNYLTQKRAHLHVENKHLNRFKVKLYRFKMIRISVRFWAFERVILRSLWPLENVTNHLLVGGALPSYLDLVSRDFLTNALRKRIKRTKKNPDCIFFWHFKTR